MASLKDFLMTAIQAEICSSSPKGGLLRKFWEEYDE
jgi:hypothetical protein